MGTLTGSIFGSSRVLANLDSNSVITAFSCNSVTTGFSLSERSLNLGGTSLTLYQNNSGYFALAVYSLSGALLDGYTRNVTAIGQQLKTPRSTLETYVFPISLDATDGSIQQFTCLCGHRIGLTAQGRMAVRSVSLGSVDEYEKISLFGHPFMVVESSGRKYLAVKVI